MCNQQKPYKVTANDHVFYFDDNDLAAIDLLPGDGHSYHALYQHRSVNATILHENTINKAYKIAVAGEIFEVAIRNELDQRLELMGFGMAAQKQLSHIKAPMPGLVLDIIVREGQEVNSGDKLLVLEAMKMENSIFLPASAVIKKITVAKGQAVEKGQVLIELSPPPA